MTVMYSITTPSPNRLDIAIAGSLDADEMAGLLDELVEKSAAITGGRMLYRITDFAMPSMAAIGVEFSRLPKLFSLIGKFKRCAVISETGWIRTWAEIEGALVPGLTIKSFGPDQAEAAEAWLAGD